MNLGLGLGLDQTSTETIPVFLEYDGKVQFVFCMGPCNLNYHNETKCALLFIAVESEPDVDLAPEVDSSDDAVKKKPILERTCKGIWNIIKYALGGLQRH